MAAHESESALSRPPRRWALSFDKINRRTHLYTAMILLPWFLMYGLSSGVLNHPDWFGGIGRPSFKYKPIIDRPFDAGPIPAAVDLAAGARPGAVTNTGDVLAFTRRIQGDTGLKGQPSVRLDNAGQLVISVYSFWAASEITYHPQSRHLFAKTFPYNAANIFVTMHVHGGFENGFLHDLWAVMVDIVVVLILFWIASGLYMWWQLKKLRAGGWVALGAGVAVFAGFLIGL